MLIRLAVALWKLAKLLLVGGVDYCGLRYGLFYVDGTLQGQPYSSVIFHIYIPGYERMSYISMR